MKPSLISEQHSFLTGGNLEQGQAHIGRPRINRTNVKILSLSPENTSGKALFSNKHQDFGIQI